jgi:hypothetical protein
MGNFRDAAPVLQFFDHQSCRGIQAEQTLRRFGEGYGFAVEWQ